jgi:hypothetical protein
LLDGHLWATGELRALFACITPGTESPIKDRE